ncbi:cation:proton antiporter [Leptolyngbya sp. PCC 6406]|uniref:cation:proton antiporter n=1 Tax=Leptolyngbya sp. PCC 6406 TaxID=1173264 RepID=UPI0002AC353B|nr:cation:proton antiporter [Leptolyngbya sp. PCC 6406]
MIPLVPWTIILWIALPFWMGFTIYFLPPLARLATLSIALLSSLYGIQAIAQAEPISLVLVDNFGVTLGIDTTSGFFILTNALVTLAVVLYCWQKQKSAFFYTQMIILHGSVNSVFISADFISLYVALEVISIATFLLITYPRSNGVIWVGLRYLLVSNTAMLFYLIGAVLVYKANQSFGVAGLGNAPPEAIALITLGFLTKGGVFVSGLWLPLTHSEADAPVSALLSGSVITIGSFPLVRCAQVFPGLVPFLMAFGVATALLGVGYALFERDTKRLLAFSTVSQVGFILATPGAAGLYALAHGLAKAALFLLAGSLPSRDLGQLAQQPLPWARWGAIALPALSIAGCPLLVGYSAKALTLQGLPLWAELGLSLAAVGTAIALGKLIFLPWKLTAPVSDPLRPTVWAALGVLLGSLLLLGIAYPDSYDPIPLGKAGLTLAVGWGLYGLGVGRWHGSLPRAWERVEHLIGVMSLVLTGLFWIVVA